MSQALVDEPPRSGPWDPFREAERLGRAQFGKVGGVGIHALQMSFTQAALHRPYFDGTDVRARQHVLFYWEKGMVKSTMLKVFTRDCATFVNSAVHEDESIDPSYLPLLNATVPAFQGSFNDGKPVLPLIQGTDFLVSSELTNLIGSDNETVSNVTNFLNEGLESGEMVVSRVKFAHASEETKAYLKDHDIDYNSKKGVLRYTTNITGWFATRPLDKATVAKIWNSGYVDRMMTVRPVFTDLADHDAQCRYKGQTQDWSQLRAYNDKMWRSQWKHVGLAPDPMHERIMDELYRLYAQYESIHGRVPGMRTMRDLTNTYQILSAFAVADTIRNDGKGPYDNVRYDLGCEERAKAFLPQYVASRIPLTHE